jgi:hypothetical protein
MVGYTDGRDPSIVTVGASARRSPAGWPTRTEGASNPGSRTLPGENSRLRPLWCRRMLAVLSGRALGGQRWLPFHRPPSWRMRQSRRARAVSERTLAIAEHARRSRTRPVMSFDRYALWGAAKFTCRPGDTGRDPAENLVEERRRRLCPRNAPPSSARPRDRIVGGNVRRNIRKSHDGHRC